MGRKPHIFQKLTANNSEQNSATHYLFLRCYYRKNRWVNATEDTFRDITLGTEFAMLPLTGSRCQLEVAGCLGPFFRQLQQLTART
jgi:hypothetical protein